MTATIAGMSQKTLLILFVLIIIIAICVYCCYGGGGMSRGAYGFSMGMGEDDVDNNDNSDNSIMGFCEQK